MWNKKNLMTRMVILIIFTTTMALGTSGCGSETTLRDKSTSEVLSKELMVILSDGAERVVTGEALQEMGDEVEISRLLDLPENMPVLVFASEGRVFSGTTQGHLGVDQGSIFYQSELKDGEKEREILGLIVNPPSGRITQVAEETKMLLAAGERVLIIFLDGFGYFQLEEGIARGLVPTLSSWGEMKKGVTVFPPVTPVAYAAMITGNHPEETGIKKRGDGPLLCPTIFDWAEEMGKSALVLEGNQDFFDLSGQVMFHQDLDGNDLVDEEIFQSAQKELKANSFDLVLVHFHSIDDVSHTYGPGAKETWQQVKTLDGYVGELLKLWRGQVIIVADHGQHEVNKGNRLGDHGDFISRDMFIPMISGEVK